MNAFFNQPILFIAIASLFVAGCSSKGPVKHKVDGVVRVNGEPVERMVVQLASIGTPPAGNLAYPTGLTDKEGKFSLSSEGDRDGAIEGEYTVVFSWLSSSELDAFDMLSGTLADAKTTVHRMTIPPKGPVEFDLNIPEKSIRRPKVGR